MIKVDDLLYELDLSINRLATEDNMNVPLEDKLIFLNRAQVELIKSRIGINNIFKAGFEETRKRIDDLQVILKNWEGNFSDKGLYYESDVFPPDYLEWCRIDASALDACDGCAERPLVIFMGNEADVALYLADENRQPSYDWATTFSTLMSNKIKIWTNNSFSVVNPLVTYYRAPRRVVFEGCTDPYTGNTSAVDVTCEFPDNVTELMIDECAAILSNDMNDYQKGQQLNISSEHNN
jgi:hypothetical protein